MYISIVLPLENYFEYFPTFVYNFGRGEDDPFPLGPPLDPGNGRAVQNKYLIVLLNCHFNHFANPIARSVNRLLL